MTAPRFSTLYRLVIRYLENAGHCRSISYQPKWVDMDHYVAIDAPPESGTDHLQQAIDLSAFDMKDAERATIRALRFEHIGLVYSRKERANG